MKRQNSTINDMLFKIPGARVPTVQTNSLPAAGMAVVPLIAKGVELVMTTAKIIAEDRIDERAHALKVLACQETARIEKARIDKEREDNLEKHQEKMKKLDIIEQAIQNESIEVVLQALESLAYVSDPSKRSDGNI